MRDLLLRQDKDRHELRISGDSDWKLFDSVADLLEKGFEGNWIEKIDGLDERYWDLKVADIVLTLHLQHYLGIMLFPGPNENDKAGAKLLIEKAQKLLSDYEPHT